MPTTGRIQNLIQSMILLLPYSFWTTCTTATMIRYDSGQASHMRRVIQKGGQTFYKIALQRDGFGHKCNSMSICVSQRGLNSERPNTRIRSLGSSSTNSHHVVYLPVPTAKKAKPPCVCGVRRSLYSLAPRTSSFLPGHL